MHGKIFFRKSGFRLIFSDSFGKSEGFGHTFGLPFSQKSGEVLIIF